MAMVVTVRGGRGLGYYWYLVCKRPGKLLNILQCTRQPSTTKNFLAPYVISAKVEKLLSRDPGGKQNFGRHKGPFIWCQATDSDL